MRVDFTGTTSARRWRAGILLFFLVLYGLISLVNHYNFRTAALDLGMIGQAVADFAHLRMPRTTMLLDAPPTGFLAQHFSLTPILAVPLYYLVGGPWALLLVQLAAVLLGALGVWHYAHAQGGSAREANWAMVLFASQWGVFSALSFEYHDNVVGAMAMPWLALWVGQRRPAPALAAALLMLVSKENMALWLVFLLLGLAWQHRKHRATVLWLLVGVVFSLGYFLVITRYVMPALDTTHRPFTQQVRYAHLGPTLPAAIGHLLTHPSLWWPTLFENILPESYYNYIKLELWLALLLSGGWALLYRPWYALMLVPVLGQKLLSNDYGIWGINAQYSIEFAPVLALAVADALRSGQRRPAPVWARRLWVATLASTLFFTIGTLYSRQSKWYRRELNNPLLPRHYRSAYPDRAALRAALARVPADVALSASSTLVPHLLNRRDIFLFPVLRTARVVALLREPDKAGAWPLSPAEARQALAQLQQDSAYYTLYEDAQLVVLARRFLPADSAATWQRGQ